LASVGINAAAKPRDYNGRFVRRFKIEDIELPFDESESLWQAEAMRCHSRGQDIIPYSECRKKVPSVHKQNKWESGQLDLPITKNLVHFNAGLCRDGDGRLWTVVRQWTEETETWWNSRMLACQLDDRMNIIRKAMLTPRGWQEEQHEDPRVIWHDGRFYVSYCVWVRGAPFEPRQKFSPFDSDWKWQSEIQPEYGFNKRSNRGRCEKNWVWFNHDGAWHFVYQFSPHIVVSLGEGNQINEYKSEHKEIWNYGEVRGGTPPVKVGNEYWTFMHSSLPWKGRQKRYHTGAYAFESEPPFKVTRITQSPLLSGSEDDTRIHGAPLCIFTQGAVLDKGVWTIMSGLNDEACCWHRIPHSELEKRMKPV
jgi:predicted GH43/DUF377 family glycosyl hydrolase